MSWLLRCVEGIFYPSQLAVGEAETTGSRLHPNTARIPQDQNQSTNQLHP